MWEIQADEGSGPEAKAVLTLYTEILDEFIRESVPPPQNPAKVETKTGDAAVSGKVNLPAYQTSR